MSEKYSKRITKKKIDTFVVSPPNKEDIDSCLNTIYKDEEGHIPNMKEIAIKKNSPFMRIFTFLFGLGIVCTLLAWVGFLYVPRQGGLGENNIMFDIQGAREVALGEATTYTLVFANKHDVAIRDATLSVYYPEGFMFVTSSLPAFNAGNNEWNIGDMEAHSEDRITITGKYYGLLNDEKSWRTFFNYTPDNFNSELQKITTLTAKITENPYTIEISGPETAVVGADTIFTFAVAQKSDGNEPVQLAITPPANFIISSSSPALGKNNRATINWNDALTPNRALVSIKGQFKDSTESSNTFTAIAYLPFEKSNQLFSIATAEFTSALQKSNVAFSATVNKTSGDLDAKPGENLTFEVKLKNNSGADMNNASIQLTLDAPSLNRQSSLAWPSVKDTYDGDIVGVQISDTVRRGEITWNNKKIPALTKVKPDDEIVITVQLPVKDSDTFNFNTLKETIIKVSASLDYTDASGSNKNVAASPTTITLVSDLAFSNKSTVTTNSQGKEEHVVTWTLTNSFHALKNIVATAEMYGDATYLSGTTSEGKTDYDPRDKKITWAIADLKEGRKTMTSGFTLVLNTKNPTQNTLLSKVTIVAEDAVTGKKIQLTGKEITLK